jgi:hypothetical protein
VLGLAALTCLLVLRLASPAGDAPAWAAMALPRTIAHWFAFTGYCGLIVLGHLANGHGTRHTHEP